MKMGVKTTKHLVCDYCGKKRDIKLYRGQSFLTKSRCAEITIHQYAFGGMHKSYFYVCKECANKIRKMLGGN